MEVLAFLLVLCSGIIHAVWNLFTKTSVDKKTFLWSVHIVSGILLLPYLISELLHYDIPMKGFGFILLSALMQACYMIFMSKAYELGEISQVYPIMRGTGALLVPVISVVLFNESLSLVGWIGLSCIVIGLFAISGVWFNNTGGILELSDGNGSLIKATLMAMLVGICITGYILIDKVALNYLSPVSLIEVSNISIILALSWGALRSGNLKKEWVLNWRTILIGSVFTPGSYLLFLFAMTLAPLSHISPVREIGTVCGVLLGVLLLREQQGLRRIILSIVITIGIITTGIWG